MIKSESPVSSTFSSDLTKSGHDRSVPHMRAIRKYEALLNEFKQRCLKDPVVPSGVTDSQYIEFLNSTDFNLEQAILLIHNNYKLKKELPNVFNNRDPKGADILRAWEVIVAASFPGVTPEGYQVLYFGLRDPNPSHFNIVHALKLHFMIKEALVRYLGLRRGYIFIVDCTLMKMGHFQISQLLFLKKCINYFTESVIGSIQPYFKMGDITTTKKFLILKASQATQKVYSMLKPFLNQYVIDMMVFTEHEHLKNEIPLKLLPQELGGTLPQSLDYYQSKQWTHYESILNSFDVAEALERLVVYATPYFIEEEAIRKSG